ncbi:hypothetical protein [Telmatospirillum sp.]|uniref:hypothetical protein n=1 Tax=Telmatospirillum sp. TaxID=2079197 RepID=UPI002843FCC9|nr:hypothetical protein [Telmatospirillum sp.]MDR3434991.1 hypothetical protein [Telmatospirillum sp.]
MIKVVTLAIVCFGVTVGSVRAEPVLVQSGAEWGQGWVFHHETGCWVATAKHVMATDSAVIVGPDERQATVSPSGIYRSPNLDIALLKLQGPLADQCPNSLIGDSKLDPLLDRINRQNGQLDIERRSGGMQDKNVVANGVGYARAAFLGKSDTDPTIRIEPRDRENWLAETDSGSPVLFVESQAAITGIPIGIVTEVKSLGDRQVITVIRMDAVRHFLEQTIPHAPQFQSISSTGRKLAGISGSTVDSNCGPDNLLRQGPACGWKARRESANQPIAITIDLGSPVSNISAIHIKVANNSAPGGFVVSTPLQEHNAQAAERRCALPSGQHEISCPVGLRESRYIRVAVDDDQVELIDIEPLISAASRWPQQDPPEPATQPIGQPALSKTTGRPHK